MLSEENRGLCRLFARVLDYPGDSVSETAKECQSQLESSFPDVASEMGQFLAFVEGQSIGSLEELYSATFDMAPALTPYIGYHLFGETPKRSAFMVRLAEAYRSQGFDSGAEMPDHLCTLLRFLSVARDAGFVVPLVGECLLPVLDKMTTELQKSKNGYAPAFNSVKLFLHQHNRKLVKAGGSL